jgi:hypothetical protein
VNVADKHPLVDNSLTFDGYHWGYPRGRGDPLQDWPLKGGDRRYGHDWCCETRAASLAISFCRACAIQGSRVSGVARLQSAAWARLAASHQRSYPGVSGCITSSQ